MTTTLPTAAAPDADRQLRTATGILAVWGVAAALITLFTAMLITVAGAPDITWTIGSLSIGWADLTMLSGWVSLAAALVIGVVSVLLLAGERAPRVPAVLLFGAGAAAVVAEYWNTFLSALSMGFTPVGAVAHTFFPIRYLDADLPLGAAVETLLWQFTVTMTLAWLAYCLIRLVRALADLTASRQPRAAAASIRPDAAPAGWYPAPDGQPCYCYWDGSAWAGSAPATPLQPAR